MLAMIRKEFRELRRDRRTMAMLIALPIVLLVVFGYAANFNVSSIRTNVYGDQADAGGSYGGGSGGYSTGGGMGGVGGGCGEIPQDAAKYPPPKDIPSGNDDDVVARQLREAAMREPDPAVREKLWDEYRRYKAGL